MPSTSEKIKLPFAAFALAFASTSYADTVLFDNGPPLGTSAYLISGGYLTYDDFTFPSAQTINSIRFWGDSFTGQPNPFPGTVSWSILLNGINNFPTFVIAGGTASATETLRAGGVANGTLDSWQVDFSIGSLHLDPGTYWLGVIVNQNGSPNFLWEVTGPNATNSSVQFAPGAEAGVRTGDQLAFQLRANDVTSPVPEPETLVLFGAGLGLLAAAKKRRRR